MSIDRVKVELSPVITCSFRSQLPFTLGGFMLAFLLAPLTSAVSSAKNNWELPQSKEMS